ncbi:DNA polymerase III subunit gamma/tau [Patescibacteria group bacterium]|nr:DNA polymerase III subunit gamma/tau [Patescibacteria group bacterium]
MPVYHLKYRPKKLSELDSEAVREMLGKILSSKEIPQVFLFAGPKGSGKTSAARIVAKTVNCLNQKNGEPCGVCKNCKAIAEGSTLDIMELDAASNRGIDDVRILKEKTYLLPTQLLKKVFIIDEVHMMTKEAFNALLKLLEEPPTHTIFILCTTDPEKIPETVLSRLIRVDFHRGARQEMKESLKRVIKGEKLEVEERVLEMIVERSEGSFRNAQKILTELFLSCGPVIKEEEVVKFPWFSFQDYGEEELAADLQKGNLTEILGALERLAERGVDMSALRARLVTYFQNQLLRVSGVKLKGAAEEQAGLSIYELSTWLQLLIAAGKQERDAVVPQLPLQLAVVEFLRNKKPGEGIKVKGNEEEKKVKKEEKISKNENRGEEKPAPKLTKSGLAVTLPEVEKQWGAILAAVRPVNYAVEAFLRSARPVKIGQESVKIEVFYPFHKDKLEEHKNRQIVENGLKKVLEADLAVEYVLGKLKRSTAMVEIPPEVTMPAAEIPKKSDEAGGDIYQIAKEIFG